MNKDDVEDYHEYPAGRGKKKVEFIVKGNKAKRKFSLKWEKLFSGKKITIKIQPEIRVVVIMMNNKNIGAYTLDEFLKSIKPDFRAADRKITKKSLMRLLPEQEQIEQRKHRLHVYVCDQCGIRLWQAPGFPIKLRARMYCPRCNIGKLTVMQR